MGRHFYGDINGKFWFAVQSSDAPERFGGDKYEPNVVSYHFNDHDHLEQVNAEIAKIENKLGDKKKAIDDFFEKNMGYRDDMLVDAGIDPKDLPDYADLLLGMQIRDCLAERGECNFEAEY